MTQRAHALMTGGMAIAGGMLAVYTQFGSNAVSGPGGAPGHRLTHERPGWVIAKMLIEAEQSQSAADCHSIPTTDGQQHRCHLQGGAGRWTSRPQRLGHGAGMSACGLGQYHPAMAAGFDGCQRTHQTGNRAG